jgi:endo-1,4-beta-xylanase
MKMQLFLPVAVLFSVCSFSMTCVTNPYSIENLEAQYKDAVLAGGEVFVGNSHGNRRLSGSPFGYEIWTNGGNSNWMLWYGPDERGGAAFRAEWNYPDNFLGRLGYFWNEGKPYTAYGNVFCDYKYERSPNGTGGNFSYIGIYGWSRNPLIEYYIVEDWFANGVIGPGAMGGGATKKGEFEVDGAVYFIYEATRVQKPSIDGTQTFKQFFSVRQETRQSGTISITEHFKQWEKLGMKLGTNMYEAKFVVEVGSGKGWLDAEYLTFYMKNE